MNSCHLKPGFCIAFSLAVVSLCLQADFLAAAQVGDTGTAPAPTRSEQEAILSAMRQYAAAYIAHLPNFICTQETQQYEAGRKPTHWHRGDTIRLKLVFDGGREKRSIELVNNRPPGQSRRWRAPLTTEGEFGTLLGSVFGASSDTAFRWQRWDTVRGHRVAVFDFAVDREHSTLKLTLSDLAHAVVPYHGVVYADPETGQVWKITDIATDIPRDVRTKSISTVIEYSEVPIGEVKYLLPVEAIVSLDTGTNNVRNEIWFSEYRKFAADSKITYASEGQDGAPVKSVPPQ